MSRQIPEWKPNLNSPIPQQWNNYVTQSGTGLEIVPAHLYDTEEYVSATTRELNFFVDIQGKNQNLTNMKVQGQLPYPESMLLLNLRLFFKSPVKSDGSGAGDSTALASLANDIVQLCNMGVVNFTIGEKLYGPYLPWALPANSFAKGMFSTGSDLLADYVQLDGALWPLVPPLVIATQQQFKVTLSWPAAAITLSATPLPIVVFFDGQRSRAIQ